MFNFIILLILFIVYFIHSYLFIVILPFFSLFPKSQFFYFISCLWFFTFLSFIFCFVSIVFCIHLFPSFLFRTAFLHSYFCRILDTFFHFFLIFTSLFSHLFALFSVLLAFCTLILHNFSIYRISIVF